MAGHNNISRLSVTDSICHRNKLTNGMFITSEIFLLFGFEIALQTNDVEFSKVIF